MVDLADLQGKWLRITSDKPEWEWLRGQREVSGLSHWASIDIRKGNEGEEEPGVGKNVNPIRTLPMGSVSRLAPYMMGPTHGVVMCREIVSIRSVLIGFVLSWEWVDFFFFWKMIEMSLSWELIFVCTRECMCTCMHALGGSPITLGQFQLHF